MKMKRKLYYLTIIAFLLASCNPMQDIENELEDMDTGYKGTFTHVLTSDDYSEIADLALARDPADTLNAAFISSNEFFNEEVSAATYVPLLIPGLYPALGKESSGMITYNYNGEVPEDLTPYTQAAQYEIPEDGYKSIDQVIDFAKYYSPSYPPVIYIPGVLDTAISAPEDGDLLLVEYLYSDVDPKIDFESATDVVVFLEGFTDESNGLGQFTATSVAGDQGWVWDKYGDGNAKMSGYSGGAVANEDWLISAPIDLSGLGEATLNISQAINYLNGEWDQIKIYISTDYNGSDIAGATWEEVTVPNMPTGDTWDFVASGDIDLAAYLGQDITLAFKYLSSDTNAATWEVAEVKVTTPGAAGIIGKAPESYKDFYVYSKGEWMKESGAYNVNAVDYDAMGSPGKYNNFSSSDKPGDYIPNMLKGRFPLAGQDQEVIVTYKYYAGRTLTLASTYTYNNGGWESSYDYVVASTAQFLRGASGWVFDPTVTFTMASADYQVIVDWVSENKSPDYLDSYGTFESYFGAGAYYVNFDVRAGNFEADDFDSWEAAVETAIGTVLLPAKFPGATTQVNGVDMFYVVNFATYSGAAGNYSMKFQVTKSGPAPEFTLLEGPY